MEDYDIALLEEKKRSSIRYLDNILSGKDKIGSYTAFSNSCEGLVELARVAGLDENDLLEIARVLTDPNLEFRHFSFLLESLIPEQKMSENVVDVMLRWLLQHCWDDSQAPKCNVLLQWFASGILNGLIEKDFLQTYFLSIFFIIKKFNLSKAVCSVISLIAECDYFMESHIDMLLALQEKCTKAKTPPMHFTYLLRFIKTVRPDLVPFEVKNRAGLTALLDKNKFYEPMQTARQRITGESVLDCLDIPFSNQWEEELDQDLTVNKNISVYMNDRNKRQQIDTLTAQAFSRAAYKPESWNKRIKISDISSFEELGRNWNLLIIPDNAISLLRTEYGLFVLAFGQEQLQQRFAHTLYWSLRNHIILKQASSEDVKVLLKLLVRCVTFMQQGLSVVSQFLRSYLLFWNGLDYRPLILKLISWITFDSYEELARSCLGPLFNLFLTTPVDFKCQILQCLIDLFTNMIKHTLGRHQKNVPYLFLPETSAPMWISEPQSVILNVIEFVEEIIVIALLQEPGDIVLLNAVYDFYEQVHELEVEYQLGTMTVIPSFLVHQSLLSNTLELLNRAAKLLLGYRKTLENTDLEVLAKDFAQQSKVIESNVKDIYYTLTKCKASKTKLIDNNVRDLVPVNVDEALAHPPMLIPHFHYLKESSQTFEATKDFNGLEVFEIYAKDLYELLSLCQSNNV
ncbi:centromere protein I [Bemisia tabaci]|uniref:centromere protein I n=1 Tax=Bemisia tabaci TaxID=7038 RepID=UPI0008F9DB83|nr:PREDICTED: centromere protein I-like [Bemisia tabaci]XP_018898622.1 PREDICTED: centromere protein I-like [Bemisia tabaci]